MIAIIWAVVLTSCGEKSTPPERVKSIAIAEASVMGHAQVMTILRSTMDGWMEALGEVLDGRHFPEPFSDRSFGMDDRNPV